MKHDHPSGHLSGALALVCAIAVFLAAIVDVDRESAPEVATVVQVAP